MQEIIRRNYDDALDREHAGQEVETPYIYCVRKGKSVAHLPKLIESLTFHT